MGQVILHSTSIDEFRAMIKEVVSAELKGQLPEKNHNRENKYEKVISGGFA